MYYRIIAFAHKSWRAHQKTLCWR